MVYEFGKIFILKESITNPLLRIGLLHDLTFQHIHVHIHIGVTLRVFHLEQDLFTLSEHEIST